MTNEAPNHWRLAAFVVTALSAVSGPAMASCEPGTCYVQNLTIRECRSVREALPDLQRTLKISAKALEVLRASGWSIVQASASTSRVVQCSEADPKVRSDADEPAATKSIGTLLADAPCTEFKVGSVVQRFRRKPCCDIGVFQTPECILPGDIIEAVPHWLSHRGSLPNNAVNATVLASRRLRGKRRASRPARYRER